MEDRFILIIREKGRLALDDALGGISLQLIELIPDPNLILAFDTDLILGGVFELNWADGGKIRKVCSSQ